MVTKIKFNFKKAKFKIAWLKALKVIFGLELQTAKISVVEPQIESQSTNVVKVGSVYILTEEEYNHLCKCCGLLMDMLGTYKQFLQAYESFK